MYEGNINRLDKLTLLHNSYIDLILCVMAIMDRWTCWLAPLV